MPVLLCFCTGRSVFRCWQLNDELGAAIGSVTVCVHGTAVSPGRCLDDRQPQTQTADRSIKRLRFLDEWLEDAIQHMRRGQFLHP